MKDPSFYVPCIIVSVILVVISVVAVPRFFVKVPADYFARPCAGFRHRYGRSSGKKRAKIVLKNLGGVVMILLGFVMLFVPGQGILALLLGIMMVDFPGRHRLAMKIVSRPKIHQFLDKLRAKHGQPPLELGPKRSWREWREEQRACRDSLHGTLTGTNH